ncbi:MAG: hypothetical protein PHZ19_08975 [Candidatus Thermoplasmatota archaeon]|nr:hypothetical protein [Candidatus Thermoplasmatota archaeon]
MVALLLCCLLLPPTQGNSIPVSKGGGTPVIDHDTPVVLWYENVTWVIDEAHRANVTAIYRLHNPTGELINLTVFLPFTERIPDDVTLQQDGQSLACNHTNDGEPFYPSVWFACSIDAAATSMIKTAYSLRVEARNHRVVTDRYRCLYLAESGRHWNGSIEEAVFTFKIARDLYSYGLSGFQVTETAGYVVAQATYANWTANANVEAVWYNINAYGKALFIVIPVALMVGAVLVVRTVRKKKRQPGSRESR